MYSSQIQNLLLVVWLVGIEVGIGLIEGGRILRGNRLAIWLGRGSPLLWGANDQVDHPVVLHS